MSAVSDRVRALAHVAWKFLVVGGISTAIEFAVYNLCIIAFDTPAWLAKLIGLLVAGVNAYFGNREWAFKGRERGGRHSEVFWFVVVNVVCTLGGVGIVAAGQAIVHDPTNLVLLNLVSLFSTGVIVVVRFVLYQWLVFRERAPREAAPDPV